MQAISDGRPSVTGIADLLARPPAVSGIDIHSAYFAPEPAATTRTAAPARVLLPRDFQWRSHDAEKPTVPLQLCEFLAYRTGLAYEPETRIKHYIETCCEGSTPETARFRFFDSTKVRNGDPEALAKARTAVDAQGYGFVFERKAFVIFRGTQPSSGSDWAINRSDALTGELAGKEDARYQKLERRYGPLPGRHVGFAIAWASLKDDVEDWLADALEDGAIDQIVYSGHSLGGAMALIAAYDHANVEAKLERERGIAASHIAAVVTFGAPAVGSKLMADDYQRLLGSRTVLLESSGDLVPRIMERWYYRMLYPLRQRLKAGVQMHLEEKDAYAKVARPWSFASEPPLSDNDIRNALIGLKEAARKAIEKAAEEEKKAARDKASKENASPPADPSSSASPEARKPDSSEPSSAKPAKSDEPNPSWVYWLVAGVFVLAAAGLAWYFVRRKLFSHDIEQRYALYLSTLAYQQLRAKHGGDLDKANAELEQHLRFVRGDIDKSHDIASKNVDSEGKNKPFFSSVQALPLRIRSDLVGDPLFASYLSKAETFV